jgi:hypothetical protein
LSGAFAEWAIFHLDPLCKWVRDSKLEVSDELSLDELPSDDDSLNIYPSELHTENSTKPKIVKKQKELKQ